ncbi:TPA: hypothetical protein R4341_000757 [Pasteurella multocida]|nr:hypothetical protein [Pasteurella multocida]HDR1877155.1 hypothetical protein [Pasteurella multocida]HDR1923344.1 hypothetical protein [Pasteurella multocida]HDR1929359.1 hypothetical protein [Pasteurella multocida]HED4463117.1 hypothetical protein [Pasteurella multocida]
MATEVNKILSEIKAGFNEHKKQVFEETKREVLDEVMAEIKKQCANGYNTTIFRLYNSGKANKVKFLLERLGFTCSIDRFLIRKDEYERELDNFIRFGALWTDQKEISKSKHIFSLHVEWSFDYE